MPDSMNMIEALQVELRRNRELLKEYEAIPTGAFGAMMIKRAIEDGEKALAGDDVTEMIRAYKELKESN